MSSSGTDAAAKPTRRTAAKKASRLAAEQLDSSTSASGGEDEGPSFSQSSKRKTQGRASSTSGGKRQMEKGSTGKSVLLSSPPKASPSSLSFPASSQNTVPKRPSSNNLKSTRLADAQQISLSSSDSDSDIVILDGPPPAFVKPRVPRRKRSSLTQGDSHRTNAGGKKRKCSDSNPSSSSTSHAESLMTPLSSPPPEAGPAKASGSRLGSRDRNPDTRASFSRGASPVSTSFGFPIKRGPTSSRKPRPADPKYDKLDLEDDVVLVFTRLDLSGAPAQSADAIWWPAQVVDRGPPLRVAPFGKHPGWSSSQGSSHALTLPSRSPEYIVPYRSGPTQLRFDEKTFYLPPTLDGDLDGAFRAQPLAADSDLVGRWSEARDLMLKAHQDAHDGMPLLLSRYFADSGPRHQRGPSSISMESSASDLEAKKPFRQAHNWLYDIPGELVLARERRKDTQYWPAKLMKFLPPTKPGEKPLYEVLFFDGTVKKMPDNEDMFFTPMAEGFKSCQLGDAEDDYGMNEGARDEDTDMDLGDLAGQEESEEQLRAPSPPPAIPAPTAFGHDLTIEEQFEYVKPVLAALLNGRHRPSLPRHIDFMKGGRARNRVTNSAWKRGELTHEDRDALSMCIQRWMRRRLRRQELGLLPPDVGVSALEAELERPAEAEAVAIDTDPEVAGDTESASSEIELPPSSFVTVASGKADSEPNDEAADQDVTFMDISPDAINVADGAPDNCVKPDVPASDEAQNEDQAPALLPTYAMLSPLDQITYCTSVLLPEAILQILLWRNGHRESPELLAPAEEERLHMLAEEKADATYWVHDVINMKRSVDRKTLPASAPPHADAASISSRSGRLRTRRR